MFNLDLPLRLVLSVWFDKLFDMNFGDEIRSIKLVSLLRRVLISLSKSFHSFIVLYFSFFVWLYPLKIEVSCCIFQSLDERKRDEEGTVESEELLKRKSMQKAHSRKNIKRKKLRTWLSLSVLLRTLLLLTWLNNHSTLPIPRWHIILSWKWNIPLLPIFHGFDEDPHKHIKEFHVVCCGMRSYGMTEEQLNFKSCPFSLKDDAQYKRSGYSRHIKMLKLFKIR